MDQKTLQTRAKIQLRKLEKNKRTPRFQRVIGRLIATRLLDHPTILPYFIPVPVEDALWAGEIEPRILELLPAVLLKKPRVFTIPEKLPDDLKQVLADIRKRKITKPFRGIPPQDYTKWLAIVGHRNKVPSLLKTFRFSQDDIALFEDLKVKFHDSEIAIIRKAIRFLAQSFSSTSR